MLLKKFETQLKNKFNLHKKGCRILIAVSGGVDSVVLTDLFFKTGYDFEIAHCNFQLRGEESMRDEEFVLSLSKKYNTNVFVKRFDTAQYAADKKMSIQEAARELRYTWFDELLENRKSKIENRKPKSENRNPKFENRNLKIENRKPESGLPPSSKREAIQPPAASDFGFRISDFGFRISDSGFRISDSGFQISNCQSAATAHNADDNAETLLANLFRGTGISGLHGIPAKHDHIIRPLLFASRDEIVMYAKENDLQWVEDSSNKEDKYTRNFIRLNVMPQLQEIFPSVKENIVSSIERFAEAEMLYNEAIASHKKKLIVQKGNEFHIPILLLQKTEPVKTILWEIIKPFGFSAHQTDEVMKLFDAENSSYISSSSHRIIKNRKHLIVAPLQTSDAGIIVIDKGDDEIIFSAGRLTLSVIDKPEPIIADENIATIDASKISYPLILRKWKPGDYFYPLGMNKKKKLARFFIDKKLSSTQKENVWVIEMNKKIVWVIGQRIDDRFKVLPSTEKVLQIKFQAG